MLIYKLVGIAFITCVCAIILKQTKPEYAMIVSIIGGVLIITQSLTSLTGIIESFKTLVAKSGLSSGVFYTILKIVGIGYITEFASSLCADSGNSSLGDKLLLGGKIVIMSLSVPIVLNIIEIIAEILPK